MKNASKFWETWSPYLAYLEDNHLDVPTLDALGTSIRDPVLIVGAGQGLLVAELRAKGFQVDGVDACLPMIASAEKRRQLKLTHADASELPFADHSYMTTIIATGVIDFLDDERQIGRILDEAARVTDREGNLLVAFYKSHPVAERFLTRIGVITPDGKIRQRRIFELSRQSPWTFISTVRRDARVGFLAALIELARMRFGLPKQERIIARNLARILKTADNPERLIESVPETIPYRTERAIKALFERLHQPVDKLWIFDPCIVVKMGHGL